MVIDLSGGGVFHLLLSFFLPLISTLVLIPLLVQLDKRKHLSAKPNSRSSHIQTISNIGGVGIFIALIVGFMPMLHFMMNRDAIMLLVCFLLLFLVGLKDDIIDSNPYFKLIAQLVVAFILTEVAGFKINSLQGFLGIYELPYLFNLSFSMVLIIAIINASNFIDGIDGLAAMFGIVSFTFSAIIFYMAGEILFLTLSVALVSALLGFLRYNLSIQEKVFMGDTGSLILGMALSVSIIKIWSFHGIYSALPTNQLWVFSIALLPLFDLLRVFLIRVTNGKSPLRADRNHIHHVLVDHCGFSHKKAAFFLSILSVLVMVISYTLAFSTLYLLVAWYAVLFVIYIFILHQIQKIALSKVTTNPFDERNAHKALLNANIKVLSNFTKPLKKSIPEKMAGSN